MLLIKNGQVVLEDEVVHADIYIEDGLIKEIGKNLIKDEQVDVIDATGQYILPGLVDLNCELYDPGREHNEDLESLTEAAFAGGYTSVGVMPSTIPVIDNKVIVEYINNRVKLETKLDVLLYGQLSKGGEGRELSEIGEMIKGGIVAVTDGNVAFEDKNFFNMALRYCEMFDLPIILSGVEKHLKETAMLHMGHFAAISGLKSMPPQSEELLFARACMYTRYKDNKVHLTKVTNEDTVYEMKFTKQRQKSITTDCTAHHLYFVDVDIASFDTRFKVIPPLREKKDVDALIMGLREGTIDCIVSGHTPQSKRRKECEFEQASFGASTIETTFLASYSKLCVENGFTITHLAKLLSTTPAKILNLDDRGKLETGLLADIVILDPNKDTYINQKKFYSKAKYSMFDKMTLNGSIEKVIKRGEVVFSSQNNE